MGIRNQKVGNVLILLSFRNGLPRRGDAPPRNDRFFDRLGSPCGGAGTASAVTERAASLVKGRWHGEAVTEGFRPQESYPKNGIPQSSPVAMPAPFDKGAKGRGLRIATSGLRPSSQ